MCKAVNPHGVGPVLSSRTESLRPRAPEDTGEGSSQWAVEERGVGQGAGGISGVSFGEERGRWQGDTRPSKRDLRVTAGWTLGQPGT